MEMIFDILTNVKAIIDWIFQSVVHEQINKQLSSQCKYFWGWPEMVNTTIYQRKRKKERTVDALALGGEEGRGKLR